MCEGPLGKKDSLHLKKEDWRESWKHSGCLWGEQCWKPAHILQSLSWPKQIQQTIRHEDAVHWSTEEVNQNKLKPTEQKTVLEAEFWPLSPIRISEWLVFEAEAVTTLETQRRTSPAWDCYDHKLHWFFWSSEVWPLFPVFLHGQTHGNCRLAQIAVQYGWLALFIVFSDERGRGAVNNFIQLFIFPVMVAMPAESLSFP